MNEEGKVKFPNAFWAGPRADGLAPDPSPLHRGLGFLFFAAGVLVLSFALQMLVRLEWEGEDRSKLASPPPQVNVLPSGGFGLGQSQPPQASGAFGAGGSSFGSGGSFSSAGPANGGMAQYPGQFPNSH